MKFEILNKHLSFTLFILTIPNIRKFVSNIEKTYNSEGKHFQIYVYMNSFYLYNP